MSSSGSEAGDRPEVEEDTSLANSDVTTKYQEAAKIANAALEGACVPACRRAVGWGVLNCLMPPPPPLSSAAHLTPFTT